MSIFFFDSSALVKRYVTETGSDWVGSLMDPAAGHTIVVADITRVEVAAALAARHRAGTNLTVLERDALVRLLARHTTTEYRAIALQGAVLDRAMELTQRHRLRGYDAVQLAAAVTTNLLLPGLTFVAADDELTTAAQAEGLPVENPNLHP